MSLHATPEEHQADPPSAWIVRKVGERNWHLDSSLPEGSTFAYFNRRRDAEVARICGREVNLYQIEEQWFAGLPVYGWRPYADIVAERARRAERFGALAVAR
jgi:hypothetical protein